jgi:hypothetical protein
MSSPRTESRCRRGRLRRCSIGLRRITRGRSLPRRRRPRRRREKRSRLADSDAALVLRRGQSATPLFVPPRNSVGELEPALRAPSSTITGAGSRQRSHGALSSESNSYRRFQGSGGLATQRGGLGESSPSGVQGAAPLAGESRVCRDPLGRGVGRGAPQN